MNNRTPFLDSVFLKQLFTTGLPGVYSDFNEKNPLNRFKGQVLYGHILKKTFPSFMNVLTNKGYKPADLMSVQGNARILMAYLKKRFNRKYAKIDPNSVEDAFQQNLDFFKNLPVQKNLFNTEKFRDACKNGYHHRDFLIAQSQSWFLNTLLGQRQNQLAAG